jgi:dTDP-3-amino-3,4,6-trideoxy-alpha-D-glucose transaminase
MTTQTLFPGTAPVPFVRLDNADPELFGELLEAVSSVASQAAFTLGEQVDAFEREFAAYCGTSTAIGVSSGTEAIALALRGLGVGPGDEVIVPANSFIATAEAVSLVGATPCPVDVDPESGLLTAALVEPAIGPRTRCVIPVHLYGRTVEMGPLVELARAAGVAVVEDACQGHGAWYGERRVGSLGDAGCFSFYPTKNLGAWGDGGAVTTSNPELAERVRLLRSHGEEPGRRHHHQIVGTTARLDAIQAAVLRIKLQRLDGWNDARRDHARQLSERLEGLPLALPLTPAGGDHVFHLYVVRCDARDRLRERLSEQNVASAIHYPVPIHRTDAYADLGLGAGSRPVTERLAGQICSLPFWPTMSDDDVERIADAVRAAVES